MQIYTNELGHMTKMSVMPIYGKHLYKPLTILNISSKAIGPVVTKYHIKPPGMEEAKLFKPSRLPDQYGHHAYIW